MIFLLFIVSIVVVEHILSANTRAKDAPKLENEKVAEPVATPAPVAALKPVMEPSLGLLQLSRALGEWPSTQPSVMSPSQAPPIDLETLKNESPPQTLKGS